MAKKANKPAADDAASTEPIEVPYSKTDADGKSPDAYVPTSGSAVLVYSKWPSTLRYETPFGVCRVLGLQESKVIGAPYMASEIPVECWNHIVKVYGSTKLFRNHFVFAARDAATGDAHARELADEKTGVEPLEQGKVGVGIEPLKKD